MTSISKQASTDAQFHSEKWEQLLAEGMVRCRIHMQSEAYNLVQRRTIVDNLPLDEGFDDEIPLETEEQVDAYLLLIAQAVAQDESKLSNADWLHMRTLAQTYVNPLTEKPRLTKRIRNYLVLVNGNVKLLGLILGNALDKQIPLPKGKAWDPRFNITEKEIEVTFYWKNVRAS